MHAKSYVQTGFQNMRLMSCPKAVLRLVAVQLATLDPAEVVSCLATCCNEPVEVKIVPLQECDLKRLAHTIRSERALVREPQGAHVRAIRETLEELDALACTCSALYEAVWSAPLAARLQNPADVLRVLCRLGFLGAYRRALQLYDPASQLLPQACDRYGIPRVSTRGTLLHAAVLSQSDEMLAAVLADFAEHVNQPDSHGHTPVYLAAVYRRFKGDDQQVSRVSNALQLLLEARADPDARSGIVGAAQARTRCTDHVNPNTALLVACRRCHSADVRALLKHRADVNNWSLNSAEARTVVSAVVCLHQDVVYDGDKRYIDDASERRELLVELLSARADVDGLVPDEKALGVGRTALQLAVRDDPSGVLARALLEARASVNLSDAYGDSPLHLASMYGHGCSMRALLAARADPAARDMDGKTPQELPGWYRMMSDVARSFTNQAEVFPFLGIIPVNEVRWGGR